MRETIKFSLSDEEYGALARLARRELRPIPMQAEHLLIEALRHERLLPAKPEPTAEVRDAAAAS